MPINELSFEIPGRQAVLNLHKVRTMQHAPVKGGAISLGISNNVDDVIRRIYQEGGRVVGIHESCLGSDEEINPISLSCIVARQLGDKRDYHIGMLSLPKIDDAILAINKSISRQHLTPLTWELTAPGIMSGHEKR